MKKLLVTFLAVWLLLPGMDRSWRTLAVDPFGQSALADDDDDNDGDDDDDDDDDNKGQPAGGGSSSGASGSPSGSASPAGSTRGEGSVFAPLRRLLSPQQPARRTTAPRRAANVPLPLFASAEIIVFNISPEDLQSLLDSGFDILETRSSPGGLRSHRLRPPGNTSLEDARDAVRALPSGGNADFNHYYRPDSKRSECRAPHCAAFRLVDWPTAVNSTEQACSTGIRLGMVDTGINENHVVFEGASLDVLRLADKDLPASRASHGTAVAALLIGQPDSRTPGLLPGAELVAIDAFHRFGKDQRTDAFTLVEALYRLLDAEVSVINLSLSGPENSVLAAAIEDLVVNRDVALIAAAGNNGPSADPAFPAAFPGVLAVTAVDANGRIYRRANRGSYIDLAAPGVNVWSAASVKGAKWKTGTSFAVPFASAALALVRSRNPQLSADQAYAYLKTRAQDLGEAGADSIYGAGLLTASGLCDD